MICIECSFPVLALYDTYKGNHIRLTVCDNCGHIADKYIEFDKVLLFIDLMLLRPEAYRHTIYNYLLKDTREPENVDGGNEEVNDSSSLRKLRKGIKSAQIKLRSYATPLRLLLLMLLFEVYLTWAYEEKNYIETSRNLITFRDTSMMSAMVLSNNNIFLQYGFFILKALLEFLIFHISIQTMVFNYLGYGSSQVVIFKYLPTAPAVNIPSGVHLDSAINGYPASPLKHNNLRDRSLTPERARPGRTLVTSREASPSPRQPNNIRKPRIESLSPPLTAASEVSTGSETASTMSPPPSSVTIKEVTYTRDYFIAVLSTAILLSNIIKIFPIVMLIWPYDNFILNLTREMVNIIHTIILIETLHIALLKQANNKYWKIVLVVLTSNLIKATVASFILCLISSFAFNVPLNDLIINELATRHTNLGFLTSYLNLFNLID